MAQVEEETPGTVAQFPLFLALLLSTATALLDDSFVSPLRLVGLLLVCLGLHWKSDQSWKTNVKAAAGRLRQRVPRRVAVFCLLSVVLVLLIRVCRSPLLATHSRLSQWSSTASGEAPCHLMHPDIYGKTLTNYTLTSRTPRVLVTGGAGEIFFFVLVCQTL
jgi:hypothetical protein